MRHVCAVLILSGTLLGASAGRADEASTQPERNYIEIAPLGGVTLTSAGDVAGGGVGLTLGYSRRVSSLVAIGPGFSFFYGLPNTRPTSGGALLARVMVGDTSVRKLAFVGEAGAGYVGAGRWFLQAGAGVFLAGFVVKGGYLLSAYGSAHSLLLSAGYTVSF
jgi:hypothetical protein